MKLLTIFKDAIQEQYGNTVSKDEISQLVDDTIENSLEDVIKKTRIPKPPSPIDIAIERLQSKRRSNHYRESHHPIDYVLWYALYHAKMDLTNTSETTLRQFEHGENVSTSMYFLEESASQSSYNIPEIELSNSSQTRFSKEITYFLIEKGLEERLLQDATTSKFVSVIEETCRTKNMELPYPSKFHLYEKDDLELPSWNKIILDISFEGMKLEQAITEWDKITDQIDQSFDKLEKEKNTDKEKLKELRRIFYIKLLPIKHV